METAALVVLTTIEIAIPVLLIWAVLRLRR